MRVLIAITVMSLFVSGCLGVESRQTKTEPVHMANGIKIGEVDSTSAIIWVRLTKNPERNVSGTPFPERKNPVDAKNRGQYIYDIEKMEAVVPGVKGQVRLTYWPAGSKKQKKSTAWQPVLQDKDFTCQMKIGGLLPGMKYSIMAEGRCCQDSEVTCKVEGGFKTAPKAFAPAKICFTVVTGQNYMNRDDSKNGHKIYPKMLGLDPDFFVHTGDIEYYDKPGPYADNVELARFKWNRMYAMPFQRAFHNKTASYFIKDDHDTLKNDCWPGQSYGDLTWEDGLAIFREQVPMGDKTYRTVRWGKDLQIWLIEGRDYRSPNPMPDGPEKTILGKEQKERLFRTVKESDATFRVLISPTPIIGPDRGRKNDNHANVGFSHEGNELREFIASQENMYIICGDRHWQYVSVDGETGVKEFSCGPTSDKHAGGWSNDKVLPEHRYLNVQGGFLSVTVERQDGKPMLTARHYNVDGKVCNEDVNPFKGRSYRLHNERETANNYVPSEEIAPLKAPFEMPLLKRPVFPDAVFRISDFGAKTGKGFNNADAINNAISECSESGGGHVLVPKGSYYTGPITLRSNVNLHFEDGAVLSFLPDPSLHKQVVLTRYEGTELMNLQPFIYARDCENIAITGLGTINGPGTTAWRLALHLAGNQKGSGKLDGKPNKNPGKPQWGPNAQLAEKFSHILPVEKRDVSKSFTVCPSLIHPVNCTNVLFEGFKIGDCGPKWTIHPVYCENVIIRRICTTFTGHSNDAIAIDSCRNVLVEYSDLSAGDDLVVVKSGTNEDGWRVNKPTKNLIVRYVNGFTDSTAKEMENAVFSIGTEISGGVENVYFHDITVNGRKFPFRIKSRPGRGGVVKGVTLENLKFGIPGIPYTPWVTKEDLRATGDACDPLIVICNAYRPLRKNYDPAKGTRYQDITIRNVYAGSAERGIYIHPLQAADFENIVIDGVSIDKTEHPLTILGNADLKLSNYKVAGQDITREDNDSSYKLERTIMRKMVSSM